MEIRITEISLVLDADGRFDSGFIIAVPDLFGVNATRIDLDSDCLGRCHNGMCKGYRFQIDTPFGKMGYCTDYTSEPYELVYN